MYKVGEINKKIFSCISEEIVADDVIITSNRINHIESRRGKEFYEKYSPYFADIVSNPDYIFPDNQINTALVCKKIKSENKYINIVLRIIVQSEGSAYKNSIITAIGENDKRFKQRLRNNTPAYVNDEAYDMCCGSFDINE